MKGFFEKGEVEDKNANCTKCKLYKTCETPRMKVSGKGEKGILVIAEAPGASEDAEGKALVGQAGQLFRGILTDCGIELDRDCWKTNAISCRPPNNRTPSKAEIKYCRPRVEQVLKKKKPHLIILLGGAAIDSFIGNRLSEAPGGVTRWRGFVVPDQRYKAWMVSTFHPSYLLRNPGDDILENLFRRDIRGGLKKLDKKVPKHGDYKIEIIHKGFCSVSGNSEEQLLAFDYETTGLKPYKKGHEILCCGISEEANKASVFKLDHYQTINWWKRMLKDTTVRKTAQNIKFEHQWSRNILGVRTRGWVWDTMQASHILDNRKGITGLKFQSYINFGQEDYSSHLDKYLRYDDGKGFNKIKEADIDEVMKYCGMDAILEYKLARKQMRLLK
jgi:DNA polymerase